MHYRTLGNTNLSVSEIGLGCEGFLPLDDAGFSKLFSLALSHGVNCMDLYSPNPTLHRRVGQAIRDRRASFVLQGHLCTVWENEQYRASRDLAEVKTAFDTMLENLGTDYLDIGMIHYVDSVETWNTIVENGILDYAKELRAAGRIRAIGLSSHNPEAAMAAIRSGAIEVLMFSVNPCYDLLPANEDVEELWNSKNYESQLVNMDPEREKLYETCQRLGVGITVMKAFGGGDLLNEKLSPAGKALTVCQCIHYALTRPAVANVLCGAHSVEQLEDALYYEKASDAEKDYAEAFSQMPKISWQGHCMYCTHCAPCPVGISVADVTKFLNLVKAQQEVPETVREHYALLTAHGSDCVACGECETRCPFNVAIRDNMQEAAKVFGY